MQKIFAVQMLTHTLYSGHIRFFCREIGQTNFNKYHQSLIDPRDRIPCCRQSIMYIQIMIANSELHYQLTAINYSDGRASELGGIINFDERRRPSLSRSERPPFSS